MAQLVSLIVSIVLVRLLDPENYGVISIVMIFITLCDAIVTGGFGNSIVQKKDADELDVNTMLIIWERTQSFNWQKDTVFQY